MSDNTVFTRENYQQYRRRYSLNQLTVRDPFRTLLSLPRFLEDFDDFGLSRGLKLRETEDEIIAEAVVAGVTC